MFVNAKTGLMALSVLVVGVAVGCKSQDSVPDPRTPLPRTAPSAASPALPAGDLRPTTGPGGTVELAASNYKFDPAVIVAAPGQKLKVMLTHAGGGSHSVVFQLPGGDVELKDPVPPGGSGAVEITAPDKEGTYVFYCPIGSHHERGMEGKLVVTRAK